MHGVDDDGEDLGEEREDTPGRGVKQAGRGERIVVLKRVDLTGTVLQKCRNISLRSQRRERVCVCGVDGGKNA
jgi:hypothetical protein